MKHLMQPNRWSCSITAACMVMGMEIEDMLERIGHDGSNILYADLPAPMCYRGFDIQEIIDVAMQSGWSATPVEAIPQMTPDGEHVSDVFPEDKIKPRIDWYLDRFDGIAYGQRGKNWHVIAWSKDERRWHDPSGPILQKEKPTIAIATFWVFVKHEDALQNLLSRNSN